MTILDIKQHSPEWYEYRKTRLGASDAGAVVDDHEYSNPYKLFKIKTGEDTVYTSEAMKHGSEMEPFAAVHLHQLYGISKQNPVVESTKEKRFFTSLDMAEIQEGKVVKFYEIKCPSSARVMARINDGEIPRYWEWQVQHSLFVTGLQEATIFVYNTKNPEYALTYEIDIQRNENMIKKILKEGKKFLDLLDSDTPPEGKYEDRTDMDFLNEAYEYEKKKRELDKLKEDLEIRRQALISMANGKSCQGGGIKVIKGTRLGSVDYTKVPELKGVNLEAYRKPSTETWTVRT